MDSESESSPSSPVSVAVPRESGTTRETLLWCMLALAFSPVLFDLVAHYAERPSVAYGALFIALFAREAIRSPRGEARPALGLGLVAVGLVIELVFAKVGWIRLARPGLALGMIGLASLRGSATPQLCLLALFAVPVPSFVFGVFQPLLRPAATLWTRLLAGVGAPLEIGRTGEVFTPDASLALSSYDTGAPLAVLIAGLCLYAGVRGGWPLSRVAVRAALLCPLALPVQLVALGFALWALASGSPELARVTLGVVPWLACSAVGGWLILRRGRVEPVR